MFLVIMTVQHVLFLDPDLKAFWANLLVVYSCSMHNKVLHIIVTHLSGSDNPGTRSVAQVMDGVINKYEEGADGAVVFEGYEKGLQALLSAYTASSPGEHFQLAQQDTTKLTQVCLSCVHQMHAILAGLNPTGISMNRSTIIDIAMQLLNSMLSVPYHAVLCCAVPCPAVLCCAVLALIICDPACSCTSGNAWLH